jgi:BirA family biotin operon repressor/biotin-[acetyl-CoA-carboxylase] ligase
VSGDRLDVDAIEALTAGKIVGGKVVVYNSTASTNDIAWQYAGDRINNGIAIFAESQQKGRGRQGNKWLSNKGQSVLCSILLLDCPCEFEMLTLAVPIAIVEAMGSFGISQARIKWPNDVLINGKKAAGVLIESRKAKSKNDYVIGIGINCHQDEEFFDKYDLAMPATSIDIETGKCIDRNKLAAALLKQTERWISIAETEKKELLHKWQQLSSQIGQRVELKYNQQKFSGNCIGVDPLKGLILQLDTGARRMFDAAHTTIIKQKLY